jgi:hypothetical protein
VVGTVSPVIELLLSDLVMARRRVLGFHIGTHSQERCYAPGVQWHQVYRPDAPGHRTL